MNKENNIIVCAYDENGNSVCEFRDLRAVKALVNNGAFRWPEIYTMTVDELKDSKVLSDIACNMCGIINAVCNVKSFTLFIVDGLKDSALVSFEIYIEDDGSIVLEPDYDPVE